MWCADEAGPYQAIPQPGSSWQPVGQPARYPHEYLREGTAKLLTLFHPATGAVRVKGVTHSPNTVLHPWLEQELTAIVAALPPQDGVPNAAANRAAWAHWQEGLAVRFTLLEALPPLRVLLILDNLAGHKSATFVCWLMAHGIMPLYTPISGSWLNMAESIQRILVGRALAGQHPDSPAQLIQWLEAVARGWNAHPTPFVWGVSGCSAANGRENGATVSVVQEPPLASTFHIKGWILMAISKALDPLVAMVHAHHEGEEYPTPEQLLGNLPIVLRALCDHLLSGEASVLDASLPAGDR